MPLRWMATIRRHKALLLKNVHKNASIAWRTGTRIRRFRRPGRTETTFALRCARRRTANRHGSRIGASADTGDGVAPEWQRRPGAYGSIRRGLLVRVETGAERLKGTWRLKNSATLRSSPHFRCTRYSKKMAPIRTNPYCTLTGHRVERRRVDSPLLNPGGALHHRSLAVPRHTGGLVPARPPSVAVA